ncbi:unnamed protein product [Cladocopium goreaui]|uniref:RNA helicase n=1 Tax=Cladocopium goreaui TaxID=2562237 RepID=A0A9P1DFA8_9DINO|nr:unnamed protein product [Cladocopium goreaui]
MATLFSLGFAAPTPIQAYCWPVAGGGRDVVGIAKTGSGKTLAFLLPPFTTFLGSRPGYGPNMLVMAPTRELACQIQLEAERFGKRVGGTKGTSKAVLECIYSVCVYGGAPRGPQLRELRAGAHLVVGTPGRLNDYLEGGELTLENCKNLVLDEVPRAQGAQGGEICRPTLAPRPRIRQADRMLDMGFEPQIRTLIKAIPRDRQTMMFSATWPREVRNLAQDYLHRPVYIQIGSHEATANKDITQEVVICSGQREKSENLLEILTKIDRAERVIVFTNTKKLCESLASELWSSRIHCVTIHGDKEQRDRDQALHSFKTGRTPVMLATDVAARGLDIKGVKLVVNYDVAPCPDDHIHRIGRTGRAGVPGRAVTFLDHRESKEAREEKAGQRVPENLRELADAGNPGRVSALTREKMATICFFRDSGPPSRPRNEFAMNQNGSSGESFGESFWSESTLGRELIGWIRPPTHVLTQSRKVQDPWKGEKKKGKEQEKEKKRTWEQTVKLHLRPFVPHRHKADAPCERRVWKEIFHPPAQSHLFARRQVYQAWCKEIEDAKPRDDPSKIVVKISPTLDIIDTMNVPRETVPIHIKRRFVPMARVYADDDWPLTEQAKGCVKGVGRMLRNLADNLMDFKHTKVTGSDKLLLDHVRRSCGSWRAQRTWSDVAAEAASDALARTMDAMAMARR